MFIIGTIEDQGRCSSHPPRVLKSKKDKSPTPKPKEDKLRLVPEEPLRPAWDDLVSVSHREESYRLQISALHTNLQAIARTTDGGGNNAGSKSVLVSLPPYETPDVQPFLTEDDFQLRSQCLVHLAAPDDDRDGDMQTATDNILMFLYEVSS